MGGLCYTQHQRCHLFWLQDWAGTKCDLMVVGARAPCTLLVLMALTCLAPVFGGRQESQELGVLANLNTPELVADWFPDAPR